MRWMQGWAWAAWVVLSVLGGGCASDPLVLALGEEPSEGSSSGNGSVGGGSTSEGSTGNSSTSDGDGDTNEGSTSNSNSDGDSGGGSISDGSTGDGSTSDSSTSDSSTSDGSTGDGSETGLVPVCGNGIVEAGEECDEQGPSAACDEDCTSAGCGDGLLNIEAGEQCDDGVESAACDVDCTQALCGDGAFNAMAGEYCDYAGETIGCDADCSPVVCGDGITNLTAGEACDNAGFSAACDEDCTSAGCGDGLLNVMAGEQCDDGGESAACDVDCTHALCGDGVFNAMAGEHCDGAGLTAACDDDCSLVTCGDGFVNAMAGEVCDGAGETAECNVDCSLSICGDGITNATAGEPCDDAGATIGCDADCSPVVCGDGTTNLTAGEACDDEGLSTACDDDCSLATCGDGVVNAIAGEECEASDLAGATCEGLGYGPGVLACGGCAYVPSGCTPGIPVLSLSFSQIKQFDFSWAAAAGTDYYQLFESASPGAPFMQLGENIVGTSASFEMPLYFRFGATYVLRAHNDVGWTDSAAVDAAASLAEAVGYVKASNTGASDWFGLGVALSEDGNTLAVGALNEGSNATGINGNQADNSVVSGAVYVFVRDGAGSWSQQAYIKASNTGAGDWFGFRLSLSGDGNTLAVGGHVEDSNATGIGGNQDNDSALNSGAVYVFVRDGMGSWSQQAYIKASNTGAGDLFGITVDLDEDGNTLAVGASSEDSNATGIGGNQADNSTSGSGAVYVFMRDGMGTWSQQAYIKASNTGSGDNFGYRVALSDYGDTLAVGAPSERSNATGVGGNQTDNSLSQPGAVYVFVRDDMSAWSQQEYIKASNTGVHHLFGHSVALSGDGNILAVGAPYEDSNATGIDGDQADNSASNSGAVYVFVRSGTWSQQAYVKASNTGPDDRFGDGVSLSGDGNTLAVGALLEDSNATGIGGNQANNSAVDAGAAYVFVRDGDTWLQHVYVKAPNSGAGDYFNSVALNGDGSTLAVGALYEDSNAMGVGGNQADNSTSSSGAVYLY